MTGAISKVTDAVGLSDTGAAGKATSKAAKMAAGAEKEALEYLKQTERLPQKYREEALSGLSDLYLDKGFQRADPSELAARSGDLRDMLMTSAQDSPFYAQALDRGEEAILRGASATGGLRSGTTSENLARFGEDALMDAYQQEQLGYGQQQQLDQIREQEYTQGVKGLAGLPSYATQIASGISGIGRTEAAGVTGAAQADIVAQQQNLSGLLDMGKLAVSGGWF